MGGLIETDADVAAGTAWLGAHEPRFAEALALTGPPPLRRRPGGFGALLHVICGQQLSVASARAAWDRLCAAGADTAEGLSALDDATLLGCGLSRPKLRYARALAEAEVDYEALRHLPEDEALARLVALKGIGRWSAEIYLLASIGRPDVFPAGDLALQEAARALFDLPERPDETTLRAMAEAWSPWRAVAARLLWAYYRVEKRREGLSE